MHTRPGTDRGGGQRPGPARPRRTELLAALSLAIDLGLGVPMEHMLRTSVIGTRLADRLGLRPDQRATIFYCALVSWIGCHADSHEYAGWFGDDIAVRRESYDFDWSGLPLPAIPAPKRGPRPAAAAAGPGAWRTAADARGHLGELVHSHCLSAGLLAEQIGLGEQVRDALAYTFERGMAAGLPPALGARASRWRSGWCRWPIWPRCTTA